MSKKNPIKRGALGRGLAVSIASARAGGALAIDGAWRRIRGGEAQSSPRLHSEARRFAQSLGELKGSYVKIGQIMALLGEHFMPPELTSALHELEAGTRPLDWQHIEPTLRRSLGNAFDDLDIEREAIAAASLAQVHRARVKATGQQLVLKVQYPELTAVIDDDFNVVVRMMRLARWIPAGRDFDAWLSTMRRQLHAETDYPRELAMAGRMAAHLSAWQPEAEVTIRVPEYHAVYSAGEVLAIEYIDGLPVTDARILQLSQARRNALGRAMLELFFAEVFDWGLMQVDSNFGNYLIDPSGGELTLLDFGSVIELEDSFVASLGDAIFAGLANDERRLADALTRLGCIKPDASDHVRSTFSKFVHHVIEPLRYPEDIPDESINDAGAYQWQASGLLNRAGKRAAGSAASRHFAIPSEQFALIVRKLTGVFTFISVLDAEFNGWEVAQRYQARFGGEA
ncbi:ABC-1 domain protein [Luminiphilus syltensis NOR5-1B]|uniref:ABC-1 domain protein n=1 Tax=Luminiphilus syltensis NOR5-1B TaxID=565045 RepID=B8KWL4_9GAMM|nr:AarF/ABC1/UbiB kinase family protein [Luminiphilus syltensis]EED35257.1 ABC-1 domain protein [Luminiphilus syltensis NOR5-1B]